MSNQRYMMRGVSASKEDVHNAIKNIDKGIFPAGFLQNYPDILGGDRVLQHYARRRCRHEVPHWLICTGKKTGDLSVWKGIAQDALIMNIDDLLCVGAVDNIWFLLPSDATNSSFRRSNLRHHQRYGRIARRAPRNGCRRICHWR